MRRSKRRVDHWRFFLALHSLLLGSFILLPVAVVVMISFGSSRYLEFPPPGYSLRWYWALVRDPSWLSALRISFSIASVVTIVSLLLGVAASLGVRAASQKRREVAIALFVMPLLVPTIVLAVGLEIFFSHLGLVETPLALILSHIVLALPFVLVTTAASLFAVDSTLERAAQTLGVRPLQVFFTVVLPLLRPALLLSALLAFLTSFDEPVIALFVAGTRTVTLPKRMWDGIQYDVDPSVAAMSSVIIMATSIAFLTVVLLRRRNHNKSAGS